MSYFSRNIKIEHTYLIFSVLEISQRCTMYFGHTHPSLPPSKSPNSSPYPLTSQVIIFYLFDIDNSMNPATSTCMYLVYGHLLRHRQPTSSHALKGE